MGYAEDLARWRLERKQAELANTLQRIQSDYAEATRERDRAIADGDTETAQFRDDDCIQLENEYAQYCPPQPQYHRKDIELLQVNAPYFQKYGTRGAWVADQVHRHVTQRVGVTQNDPHYAEMMRKGMEFYGEKFGCPYDRGDEALTATEAAKISGLSPKSYNYAYQQLKAQGRVK